MINDNIRTIMKIYGLNQKQFAEKTNVSGVYINKILTGKRKVTVKYAITISNTFNVSLDWLFYEEKNK